MTDEKVLCPNCEHENDPEARFCEQCGADLTAPASEAEPEVTELVCANCGETNAPEARFCKACGESLVDLDEDQEPEKPKKAPKTKPKKERKRLPTWARILITTLVVAIVAAALGIGFAYASPYLNAYMTYSPERMERAGLLAQEFVERVYPEFTGVEPDVWVETIGEWEAYVVDFHVQDGDQSLGLRVLVNKPITAVRVLEYVELGAPEPYDDSLTIDAGEGEQVQPVPSEGLEEILINPRIVDYDDFSNLDESRWAITDGVDITAEGLVELVGESPFATNLFNITDFTGGEAFIFSLSFTAGTDFEITLDSGEWQSDDFRRAGFYVIGWEALTNIWHGADRIDEQQFALLPILADRSYGVLGAVDGGKLLILVWDEQNPSLSLAFEKDFGEEAVGRAWRMHVAVDKGTVTLDEYYQLSFDGYQ